MTDHQILQTTALPVDTQPSAELNGSVVVLDQLLDPEQWLRQNGPAVDILITHAMRGASKDLVEALPNLRLIANFGAGLDLIPLGVAEQRGIVITASGDVLTDDVADLAIWQMLTLLRGLKNADAFVRSGLWAEGPFPLGRSARGRKLGLLGFGRIGKAIAARACALGLEVAYHSRRRDDDATERFEPDSVSLAGWAEILVVALPGGPATESFVGSDILNALGSQGLLINIARGNVVDEQALIDALTEHRLGGAALDVYRHEPDPYPSLLAAPNLLLTPHVGSATCDSRRAMLKQVVDNIRAFRSGARLAGVVQAISTSPSETVSG